MGDALEKYRTELGHIKVLSVERIQNMSMWQSYAVKRQTVLDREKNELEDLTRLERVWLFHGTDEDTVPKITSMGFNRSFCFNPKNATLYGKGVYFALDSGYSARQAYAKPNAAGVQHMFLVRVTVGVYCQGKKDVLTPDVRSGHALYDSTVN